MSRSVGKYQAVLKRRHSDSGRHRLSIETAFDSKEIRERNYAMVCHKGYFLLWNGHVTQLGCATSSG